MILNKVANDNVSSKIEIKLKNSPRIASDIRPIKYGEKASPQRCEIKV